MRSTGSEPTPNPTEPLNDAEYYVVRMGRCAVCGETTWEDLPHECQADADDVE